MLESKNSGVMKKIYKSLRQETNEGRSEAAISIDSLPYRVDVGNIINVLKSDGYVVTRHQGSDASSDWDYIMIRW